MTTPTDDPHTSDPDSAGEAPAWLADPDIRKCHSYSGGVFWKDENLKYYYLTSPEFGELMKDLKARVEEVGPEFDTELRLALYRDEQRQIAAEAAAAVDPGDEAAVDPADQLRFRQAQDERAGEAEAEPSSPSSSPSSRGSSEPGDVGADWIPDGRDAAVYPEQGRRAGMTSEKIEAEADAHPAATSAPDGAASLAPLPPPGEPEGEPSNPDLVGEEELSSPSSSPSSRGSSEPGDVDADWIPASAGMTSEELSQESENPQATEDPGVPLDRSSEMDLALGKPRHNQWTRRKMVLFLRELAASQSVSQAARSVGMSRQSAYKLRTRLNGTPFALGWELALEAGIQQLAHAVMDRALNGEEVPHYHRGELVGTSRRYDNHLARWVLENPWKLGRMQIAREYAADGFDKMLERIECEPLDWQQGEPLPGHTLALPELDEDGEPVEPDFEEEEELAKLGADGKPVPRVWSEEDRYAAAKRIDVNDFLRQRSWYASESRRQAAARPGRREPQTRAR